MSYGKNVADFFQSAYQVYIETNLVAPAPMLFGWAGNFKLAVKKDLLTVRDGNRKTIVKEKEVMCDAEMDLELSGCNIDVIKVMLDGYVNPSNPSVANVDPINGLVNPVPGSEFGVGGKPSDSGTGLVGTRYRFYVQTFDEGGKPWTWTIWRCIPNREALELALKNALGTIEKEMFNFKFYCEEDLTQTAGEYLYKVGKAA